MDEVICGTSESALETTTSWREMRPFQYLKSKDVKQGWKLALEKLSQDIKSGELAGHALESRMHDILLGVERLEDSEASVTENFAVNLADMKLGTWALAKVRRVVDERCRMIDEILETLNGARDVNQQLALDLESPIVRGQNDRNEIREDQSGDIPAHPGVSSLFRRVSSHIDRMWSIQNSFPVYWILGLVIVYIIVRFGGFSVASNASVEKGRKQNDYFQL